MEADQKLNLKPILQFHENRDLSTLEQHCGLMFDRKNKPSRFFAHSIGPSSLYKIIITPFTNVHSCFFILSMNEKLLFWNVMHILLSTFALFRAFP